RFSCTPPGARTALVLHYGSDSDPPTPATGSLPTLPHPVRFCRGTRASSDRRKARPAAAGGAAHYPAPQGRTAAQPVQPPAGGDAVARWDPAVLGGLHRRGRPPVLTGFGAGAGADRRPARHRTR